MTSKGQVTIPKDIRRRHGIRAGSEIEFIEKGTDVVVRRRSERAVGEQSDFANYLDRMTGVAELGMSTDDFMRLLRGE